MNSKDTSSTGLYNHSLEHSACGVGFITRKDGVQTHDVIDKGHEALCAVPHRGGMSSEGVGDGAGITVDLSAAFFSRLTDQTLTPGAFGVGNFFMPGDPQQYDDAIALVERALNEAGMNILLRRDVAVNQDAIEPRGIKLQLPIMQWVFTTPHDADAATIDRLVHEALLSIEAVAYTNAELSGLYPLSLSVHTQVLKGRLNSWELIPYFEDLIDPDHKVRTLFFHTRFSTNTDPHPSMAQPFRLIAHNGELNTDKKNRLSETAVAMAKSKAIIRPSGQSDSCRLDQTLNARVFAEGMDLVAAVVSMMPPAWENDTSLSAPVRDMLAYFSLYEEKNDGPAALVFGNGRVVGARLDRLGLRPLRSVETEDYLAVMSEAGQIEFSPAEVLRYGRIEAGGMLYFDHAEMRIYETHEALEKLALEANYSDFLAQAQVSIDDLPDPSPEDADKARAYHGDLTISGRYVAYTHNQESFKFLMDPMLTDGSEKVSAMGYGNAINALSDNEGGVAKYFSQRFAQVTNPPLDSIREADGMTLRVALGEKPHGGLTGHKQIVVDSPVLTIQSIIRIKMQKHTPWKSFDMLYETVLDDAKTNEADMVRAIDDLANDVIEFAREEGGIAILSDRQITQRLAAMPMTLAVSAVNQRLIEEGLRLRVSLIVESGQIASSHHIACALGFGASAVYALAVRMRAEEKFSADPAAAFLKFAKASEKALMKTMGKVGLCTVESYSGGEFFEPNFLDTSDPVLHRYLPNMHAPVGGVRFDSVAQSVVDWHQRALSIDTESDVPILGLFKERAEGAGHSYGTMAVRGFVDMTEESIVFPEDQEDVEALRLLTLKQLDDAFDITETGYANTSFDALSPEQIDGFEMTPGYRAFSRAMADERHKRPAALRDVLAFPADITYLEKAADIKREMMLFNRAGNRDFVIRGLRVESLDNGEYRITLTGPKANDLYRLDALVQTLEERFGSDVVSFTIEKKALWINVTGMAEDYLSRIRTTRDPIALDEVQPASEITRRLASGAMSHGALVATAHEAVAHGTNMVGGLSNCGEGGEHLSRYGTLRASRIKQFASGRFGVWAGYLADPKLEEIEIKIGQGAKPGEGGQLPGQKVTVEIAAARGGTPGVELISPPPHHDTYSIEDLAQLIHDAKAARVRVIVKLVSSEGIGTIAVGVAKAGADVINVAGGTGGTGAASVTSLKYTGRAAELGIAEVHQALCTNGIRRKVTLRCSGAMQTGSDVVKASLLGGDSFEFGTTALMMLKCVMAKNCNIKCPAGLTTNAESFDGDPRALAQYLLNIGHEVREVLAKLGFRSLDEARGRADLLHLLDHPASVGQLNVRDMLVQVPEVQVENPTYLERDFSVDDFLMEKVHEALFVRQQSEVLIEGVKLNTSNKSVGGQLSIDIERLLNHSARDLSAPAVLKDERNRRYLAPRSICIETAHAAGQSFGAFCNDGIVLNHRGTCNDGVGKGICGGEIVVNPPVGAREGAAGDQVLIGNFALFGATGGRLFVHGQAGDRFAVRNSGATAVIEGVGDFCCEYMTNGAVLNIGRFSKGFGNGMSGGFAYQYDPEDLFDAAVSHDSVIVGKVDGSGPMTEVHADAIQLLLTWHVNATGSALAQRMLENWANERQHFVWIMPRALLQYQDAEAILSAKSRKELLEELSVALAQHQITRLKTAWKTNIPVLDGIVPQHGQDSETMYELINNWTVLDTALDVIRKRRPGLKEKAETALLARNLVMTKDFDLMTRLAKHGRVALGGYDDSGLAVLVANKRLGDFKEALTLRNARSIDSPGTYGWIIDQTRKNLERLGHLPSFAELFAGQALPERLAAARAS
ncbi:MAG: glutamate synthase-related protein [Pseudomonadota bacterium]